MAGDWIKFRTSLLRDGRVRNVSRSLATNVTVVIGGLVTLWSLGDEQADENGVLYGYTKDDINDLIGVKNFCESLPECWINLEGEYVQLPDYQEHNGGSAKKRATDQKRQKKRRESVTQESDKKATREEKRREEIYIGILDYLNEKAGKRFKHVQSNLKFVEARLKEYSEEDLRRIVDAKCEEWLGTPDEKYLRPETLFNATKCASYYGNLGSQSGAAYL